MRVIDHTLLTAGGNPVRFEATPNGSGPVSPRFLVIHYTGGRDLESSVAWLKQERARASAHLVIGRDGEIVQMAAFNRKTWHAGRSSWKGVNGLNACSIGIELDNAGELSRTQGGGWRAWFGETYTADEVLTARHKHDGPAAEASGWHVFPGAQLEALMTAAAALQDAYRFEAVLGHDDIAPGRKRDPGPAFPMEALRARLFGRDTDEGEPAPQICEACGRAPRD